MTSATTCTVFRAVLLAACLSGTAAAAPPAPASSAQARGGDFAFQVGEWRVHHRVKRAGQTDWQEFEGECSDRAAMGGLANVEDNIFYRPEGVSRGLALRTFDPATGEWAIWWIDGRNPHGALDPPMKGRFVAGVGTFYADGELNGKPVRTRFIWSQITATSAQWEQAYSFDAGRTWDTNWIMQFRRRR